MNQYDINSCIQTYSGIKFYDIKMIEIGDQNHIPFGKELVEFIKNDNDIVNIIMDFTNCKITTQFMHAFKKDGKDLRSKIDIKIAVGATGITYVLLRIYQAYTGKPFNVFRTRNEAMEYIKTIN